MAPGNLITLRPEELDRLLRGARLSGMTDGEGSFILAWERSTKSRRDHKPKDRGTAVFRIALRYDDTRTLLRAQEFFGCGWITQGRRNKSSPNAQPTTLFCVSKTSDLKNVIVPHFEKHPLDSKKQRDSQAPGLPGWPSRLRE